MNDSQPPTEDHNPAETQEWLDSLESVLANEGIERATFLLRQLSARMTRTDGRFPYPITTPYRNTIPVEREASMPGDMFMERRIRSMTRWNALAMVLRANRRPGDPGGHVSTFASAATLYDVGFNHFFRGETDTRRADLVFFQGHSAPGIYARSFLEGRLSETQLENFRREVGGTGLSSYPHPWLMPEYWQFPTVSMGLGPLQAIYQAHLMKYLDNRGLLKAGDRKVWVFLGDGECDEPESLGALSLAARERLDNLIFVVNCNLQRLDGPVRGNGKIIQELESTFRGAGWNVIKVIWGRLWDPLFAKDTTGALQRRADEAVDGEYQNYKAKGGAYTRAHFFGKDPELLNLVEHLSDDDIMRLNRGGHDPFKVYAAYHEAAHHVGQPTVILAKTVKGYGMGAAVESEYDAHQAKKLTAEAIELFRDRFGIPLSQEELANVAFYRPPEDSPEAAYLRGRQEKLGGHVPRRVVTQEVLEVPALAAFSQQLEGSGERENSTTMVFTRILAVLLRDKKIGKRVVPIVPDEARTFGMEGMFRQIGIYSASGQLYEPLDADQLSAYREATDGQVLQEGITEAGAFSSWLAAATAYSTHRLTLIPFYIYYSMFGFQRVGDLAWAAGDSRARGFLLGGTSGRTTLNGEGLQHQDGHSHVLFSTIPNCITYDPCYGYELAVIIQEGLRRMFVAKEDVFYYVTLMNEKYPQPAMPAGVEEGILRGIYRLRTVGEGDGMRVRLMGSGTILREVEAAAEILHAEFGVIAEIYSLTSATELAREARDVARWNLLNPKQEPRQSYFARILAGDAPIVAASDYIKALIEPLRAEVSCPFHVLGTDGFGRSDTRQKLRDFFEVDRRFVALAALKALADREKISRDVVDKARESWAIAADKPNPRLV
jgi:pyruvate dehydrogenase E1 component